jgi:hypothetical protein
MLGAYLADQRLHGAVQAHDYGGNDAHVVAHLSHFVENAVDTFG